MPAILLKIGNGLKKAAAIKNAKDTVSSSDGGNGVSKFKIVLLVVPLIFLIMIPVLIILLFANTSSYALSIMQSVDPNSGISGSGNLIYGLDELEKYYEAAQKASVSGNKPATDLASTEYKNVEGFNNHIKQTVQQAGYGTRAGVVAAGVALVGDYIVATGKRLRYSQDNRQGSENEGISNEDFYMDCSSFAWWALYNGGFKIPCYPYTGDQWDWASEHGYLKDSSKGQAGDFLINSHHIVLIIGEADEDNYYVAEFSGTAYGAPISKKSKNASGYKLIDMEEYYNDSSNKR